MAFRLLVALAMARFLFIERSTQSISQHLLQWQMSRLTGLHAHAVAKVVFVGDDRLLSGGLDGQVAVSLIQRETQQPLAAFKLPTGHQSMILVTPMSSKLQSLTSNLHSFELLHSNRRYSLRPYRLSVLAFLES